MNTKAIMIQLYRCPLCESVMEMKEIASILSTDHEVWTCSKCKNQFKLKFTQIKKKSRKKK
jgi:transposase-like protein